jgi:CHAT domain-containing protein
MAAGRRIRLALGLAVAAGCLVTAAGALVWATAVPRPADVVIPPPADPVAPRESPSAPVESVTDLPALQGQLTRQIATARAAGGDNYSDVAELLIRLAEVRRDLGQLAEARAAYAEVLAIHTAAGEAGHWRAVEARMRSAALHDEGERPEAEAAELRRARELYRAAARMNFRGDYLPAVPVCEESLALRRASYSGPHVEVADCLLLLGQLQASRGEFYPKAFKTLTRARDMIRETLGADHPAYGTCLHWLGTLEDDRGAFVEAKDFYTAALAVFEKARKEFRLEYARTLNKFGHMMADWWVFGAEAKITWAMDIREKVAGRNTLDYAESLHDLGVFMFNTLHFDDAKKLFAQSLGIRERMLGEGHPDTAETLSWLGRAQTEEMDLTLGHSYHLRAVAVAQRAHGRAHPRTCRCLDAFARTCAEEYDFERAESIFREVEEIRQRLGIARHPAQAEMLCARGKNLDEWATRIVSTEDRKAEFAPAEREYDKVLALCEGLDTGSKLPVYGGCLAMKAGLYYYNDFALKSQEYSRSLLVQSLRAMSERGRPIDHQYYVHYLHSAWQLALAEPDYPTAARFADEMIDYGRDRFGYSFPHWTVQGPMSRAGVELHRGLDRVGRADEVFRHIESVNRFYSVIAERYSWAQSQRARLSTFSYQFEVLSGVVTAAVFRRTAADVYQHVVQYRGHVAAAQALDRFAHDAPELADTLARLRQTRQQLARVVYRPPLISTEQAAWVREVHRLSDEKDDLESELAFRVRKPGVTPPQPTVADIQRSLPADTVLVDYFSYIHLGPPPSGRGRMAREPQMVAFVVRPQGPPECVPLGPREKIERAVEAWRREVADYQRGKESAAVHPRSKDVARLIWAPVAEYLGDAKRVLVAPDGPVCYVPFAVLPGRVAGTYLIEDLAVGYVTSTRAVVDSYGAKPESSSVGVLAVGGVTYDEGGPIATRASHPILRSWPDLPSTGPETDQVIKLFRGAGPGGEASRLAGRDATPDGFTRMARGRRYIHYAGHGYFADQATLAGLTAEAAGHESVVARKRTGHPALLRNQLLLSGLVLARSPGTGDGILTAEQVGGLDLRGTEMVVLSACDTGLGNVAGGEGVIGLKRAFLTAGARTVVASLWKLDDAATADLMDEFYRNLWVRKLGKLEALREAQLTMLRSPDKLTSHGFKWRGIDPSAPRVERPTPGQENSRTHPMLWGAFVLTGDGR